MFFTINTPHERPMTRRQMDRLLKECEQDLFGKASAEHNPERSVEAPSIFNARIGRAVDGPAA